MSQFHIKLSDFCCYNFKTFKSILLSFLIETPFAWLKHAPDEVISIVLLFVKKISKPIDLTCLLSERTLI